MEPLERLRLIQGSSDVTVSTFPLKRDILRRMKKLKNKIDVNAWNETYRLTFEHLHNLCLGFAQNVPGDNSKILKTGIYKGLDSRTAKFMSLFFRSEWIRMNYNSENSNAYKQLIYDMIVFPHPGGLYVSFDATNGVTDDDEEEESASFLPTIRYHGTNDSIENFDSTDYTDDMIEDTLHDAVLMWCPDVPAALKDYDKDLMEWMYFVTICRKPETDCPFFLKESQRIYLSQFI